MITKETFEENAVKLMDDVKSFEASEDVIRHAYGDDAVTKFKAFVSSKGWVISPNMKSKTIRVESVK